MERRTSNVQLKHGACSRLVAASALCITVNEIGRRPCCSSSCPQCISSSILSEISLVTAFTDHLLTGYFCLFSDEEATDFAHFRSAMFIFKLLITRVLCIFWKGVPCWGCETIFSHAMTPTKCLINMQT